MDNSRNRQNENLGVNKLGKTIKKSSLHESNYVNNVIGSSSGGGGGRHPQHPVVVYNITKNEFRDLVQHLTGSPNHPPHMPPPQNQIPPKPKSTRLQKVRPPPMSHVRPQIRLPDAVPAAPPPVLESFPPVTYNNEVLPGPAYQFTQPSSTPLQADSVTVIPNGDMSWNNVAHQSTIGQSSAQSSQQVGSLDQSHISSYVKYFEDSLMEVDSWGNQSQPQPQPCPNYPPQTLAPSNFQITQPYTYPYPPPPPPPPQTQVPSYVEPQSQTYPYPPPQTQAPSNVEPHPLSYPCPPTQTQVLSNVEPQPLSYPYPPQTQVPSNVEPHPLSYALIPSPPEQVLPPPSNATDPPVYQNAVDLPVPMNASNSEQLVHDLSSPQTNEPLVLPSPTSQIFMPSPNGCMTMPFPSPMSLDRPQPLPDIQFPSPSTPTFIFAPATQSGILDPDLEAPLHSPTFFPMSPSEFFPMSPWVSNQSPSDAPF